MNIFVIDDQPLMREAITHLIARLSRSAVVVEFDRISQVPVDEKTHGLPTMICTDLTLPYTAGVSDITALKNRFPKVHIVVLTAASALDYEEPSIEAGADAFIPKSAGATEIGNVLRLFLTEGLEPLSSEALATAPQEKLSRRQQQILGMLDKGLSNRDIAQTLDISEHTVKVHLWRLFKRLNVKSRSQASHLARTQGLLPPGA